MDYEYRDDWAASFRRTCDEVLRPKGPPEKWLEVGLHEGRSAVYAIENYLMATSLFVGVDPFGLFPGQEYRCRRNIALASARYLVPAIVLSGTTDDVTELGFDGAYLDGPKDYVGALAAMKRLLRIVRPGGVIVLDDVHWDDDRREIRMDWISPVGKAALDATFAKPEAFATCGYQWVYTVPNAARRPSECQVPLGFMGCAELESAVKAALQSLADHGDEWSGAIPLPTTANACRDWSHEHPDGTTCRFLKHLTVAENGLRLSQALVDRLLQASA
jgi:hypothetical protein